MPVATSSCEVFVVLVAVVVDHEVIVVGQAVVVVANSMTAMGIQAVVLG